MDITRDQQLALDDALVAPANRLMIGKCNLRLSSDLNSKEVTLQVVYDVLKLTPIYMQEFWATAIVHHHSIRFKMNNTKHIVNLGYFREMLQICPKLPDQQFEELPFEKEILMFLRDLGHSGEIKVITDVNINKLHQPWRSFAVVINKCLSGKSTGYDSLRLSQAQILWGIYHKKNVDYAYLLWEDFVYQVENKNVKRSNEMYYPRFTKVIVNFFMTKDQSIPKRNKVNWHFSRDDPMFTTIKFVSRHEDTQLYGAILPYELTNEAIKDFESYKEYYAIASGAEPPKTKASVKKKQVKSDKTKTPPTAKGKRLKTSAKEAKPAKKKQHAKTSKAKGTDEGTGDKPGVPDVPTYAYDDEQISWKSSDEEDDDEVAMSGNDDDDADNQDDDDNDDDDQNDDNTDNENDDNDDDDGQDHEQADLDNDGDDFVHPKFSTHDEEDKEEDNFDPRVQTPSHVKSTDDEDNVPVTTIVEPPLLSTTTLPPPPTPLITYMQQIPIPTPATALSSSLQDLPNFGSLFGFDHRLKTLETDFSELKQTNQFAATVSLIPDIVDAYLANKMHEAVKTAVQLQSDRLRDEAQAENADFINKLDDNIKKIIKDQVKEQVKAQVSKILSKIEKKEKKKKRTVNEQLKARSDEQKNLYKALVDSYESDKLILYTYRDTVSFKRRRDDEDKDEEPSAGSNRGSKRRRAGKEPESTSAPKEKTSKTTGKSTEGSKSHHKSAGESAQAEEPMHTAKDLEEPAHQEFKTGVTEDQPNEETSQLPDWFQKPAKPPTPDRDWNKTLPDAHGPVQPWLSSLAQMEDPRESFNELMDTPLDFSAFVMNRLKVDTLTPELLAGPTFELMKGSCKSLVELEYFLEEVYKATTDQLDWINPEGQQYPHDLRKPLPLIPNSRGCQVIPFDHFINNDLEYLSGGVSSRKYTTSVTKTKVADYGHIKWIKDLVPNKMWSQVPVSYDKHALWGISHWGQKRQQFYGFTAKRESA
ncbi:hypothetical protein Tco_0276184 [Tanacetum coccineum]